MDEEELHSSLETYKSQLHQVEQAIQAAGSSPDLEALRNDLTELVNLTQGSLLSLKKSQLLKEIDSRDGSGGSSDSKGNNSVKQKASLYDSEESGSTSLDNEYAAFQEMLGTDVTSSQDSAENKNNFKEKVYEGRDRCNEELDVSSGGSVNDLYKDIVGTRCQAPYAHDWGEKAYGNALIAGVETGLETEMPKVQVMFSNPTHSAMLPCKYFLSGSCRFTDQDCRFSHGHLVELEDLREYIEPDHSLIKLESKCLARYDDDDLWYKATVVEVGESEVKVTFDSYSDDPLSLLWEDVLPLDDESDSSSESGDDDIIINQPISRDDSDDEDDFPVFLWKPSSHGLGDLGQWEAHTKGVGSRLLSKMGYIPGQGLGKNGEGRIEPVPIQLLPQGKSLDKIMALKEISGNRDMFDAMKRQEKLDRNLAKKLENQYKSGVQKTGVFDFINKKLGGKKGKLSELIHHHGDGKQSHGGQGHSKLHRNISEQDLKEKSDKNINIQLLKTSGEMKSVQKELMKLKESLSRNERDKSVTARVKTKISSLESYLEKLKSSENLMESHQQKRKNHKKMTVF
ncbi:zinc finger CCCH-type with G patch domain-containing protein-like [Mya arenaria]|uniref:zinc finger CCCH-type with G patch domain-containing protein-like n=1 Tax=Mya arenaria TaxID=6604 RepID=UPI0022DFB02F|nr:zinc finger CCCH-type with G patch domain-containing protein-like [Mya arenaria]